MIKIKTRYDIFKQYIREPILDIGGTKGTLHEQIRKDFKNIFCLDLIDPKTRQQKRFPDFIIGDAHIIPFKNEKFNTIIAGEIIEHLQRPSEFIKECYRVLKLDGILVITTPNRGSLFNRIFQNYENLRHISLMNTDQLTEITKRFTLVKRDLIPYRKESSWGSSSKGLIRKFKKNFLTFKFREIISHFIPKKLKENMIFILKKGKTKKKK